MYYKGTVVAASPGESVFKFIGDAMEVQKRLASPMFGYFNDILFEINGKKSVKQNLETWQKERAKWVKENL